MPLLEHILGRPLASDEDKGEKIGPTLGIPVIGLDALASAAYGPEAALTILLPLGVAGIVYSVPITGAILGLLTVLYLSYRQTIGAYPNGGGSYTVARENLGLTAGLLAAASLTVDYVLNVAVGISSGVGALISAVPPLQPYILPLCLAILAVLAIVNLRGVRESGLALAIPTYAFVLLLGGLIVAGIVKILGADGGHPQPVTPPPALPQATEAVGLWIIMRAFASGCTAMTGVEAISNGIDAFRPPATVNAKRTLTGIVLILGALLAGLTFLSVSYGIGATPPGSKGFQSVISELTGAVEGRGLFYYLTMASVIAVLALSANTSFAGFPRLCRLLAVNSELPRSFSDLGRRLVLLARHPDPDDPFGDAADRVRRDYRSADPAFRHRRLRGIHPQPGRHGAALAEAGLAAASARHADECNRRPAHGGGPAGRAGDETDRRRVDRPDPDTGARHCCSPASAGTMTGLARNSRATSPCGWMALTGRFPVVVLSRWSLAGVKALRHAYAQSDDVTVVHVNGMVDQGQGLKLNWDRYVDGPVKAAGRTPPQLVLIESPYREFIKPLLEALHRLEEEHPGRRLSVIVPELAGRHWYDYLLHNQRSTAIKAALLLHGDRRMVVTSVPWHLATR